jgi:NADH:ubiquinone oxidoreductase subunit 2 (subunit N)
VNPATRFAASLLASLALWAPTMLACLRGEVELTEAGIRYVAAFVAASVAFALLGRLVDGYASTQARLAEEAQHRRRADDEAADGPATVGIPGSLQSAAR